MITVTISENGNGQRLIQPFDRKKDFQAVHIDICHRCTGVIIFGKRKESVAKSNPAYVVFAWQIPPTWGSSLRVTKRQMYLELKHMTDFFDPVSIFFCGGLVNNEINDYWYYLVFKKMIAPFMTLFPECKRTGIIPDPKTMYTRMYMDRPNKVRFVARKMKNE